MSSRRKSSTPCMVRPASNPPQQNRPEEEVPVEEVPMEEPVEVPMSAEVVGHRPLRSPDPGEENTEPPPQQQEEKEQEVVWGPGPECKPSSLDNHEVLEPSEQKEEGPEGAAAPEMDPEDDDDEEDDEEGDSETSSQKTQSRGYVCKYCSFSTQNLADFKDHVDTHHPNVILNPLYLCAVCNFSTKKFDSLTDHNEGQHPGETNFKFKRVTMDRQTVLEQTIESQVTSDQEERAFPPCISATDRPLYEGTKPNGFFRKDQITAVNINGTVIIPEALQGSHVAPLIIPEAVALQGALQGSLQGPHVAPLLQRPPNFSSIPKIAVPLNTTKYNPSLDTNPTLMTSFNKFPYPTHAELSWLTAASKHPEEQIKVWFTTQRLKQGITWSPEEVEEARKKMFNGSIPPAHHTFSPSSTQAPPLGLHTGPSSSSPARVSVCSSYALVRPLIEQTESKRPIMAVAPHSGDPKDKGLMAPPPPPPPLKDRPPVPMEMKRPAATPLVTTDTKRKNLGVALMPSPAALPQVLPAGSRPSMVFPQPQVVPSGSRPFMVFPQSARRYMAPPPPIIAPPYKNYLIPHPSSFTSREKHPITHALLAPDSKPPGSPQTKRPSIIQAPRAPRHPAQLPAFTTYSHKLKEQQGMELKAPYPRGDKVLTPLSNGVPRDLNLQNYNGVLQVNGSGEQQAALQKCAVPTQFPLLERMKGKTAEQLKVLEETFLRNSFPAHGDVDALATATRLSRQEIKSWFLERRALRDNLEQALLNSMGTKKTGSTQGCPGADRRQQLQTLQLNGIHKSKRSPPPPTPQVPPPIVAPSTPNPPPGTGLPDGRTPAVLKDDWALTRWPSPEEMSQLEARTGLPRSDLVRWFTDSRLTLKTSGSELTQLFHTGGRTGGTCGAGPIGGQQGGRGNLLLENAPIIIQRCREGGAKSNGTAAAEANASRIAENYASSLGSQQHQDWSSSRLRQQSSLEMKSGGGGAGEVLGSWMENGHEQHTRELPLEHQQKLEG